MLKSFITYMFFCLVFSSCAFFFNGKQKDNMVARVFDKYLYMEDVVNIIPSNANGKDSAMIVKKYINNWVKLNLLIHQAESNLEGDSIQKEIEKQLLNYRNSLITYAFEKELVSQKLDTIVNEAEIENYYKKHPQNFELKDNIIKVLYVKVKKNAPNLKKVQDWYKSNKVEDIKKLEDYCHQFAENFYADDQNWLLFDDLLKEIPIKTYNKEQFLQNNRLVEVQDSAYIYFLNIKGFKIKDSTSPLNFERDNIKNIILNKRKLELIDSMNKGIYDNGLKNKSFEIY